MSGPSLSTSLTTARRLTVTKQHLAGRLPTGRPTTETVLSVIRDLAYVQWDPVTIVAPSHLLSLWARVGDLRPTELERLLWEEKRLFEHWTPMASLVLTEDYPIYLSLMRRYPESLTRSWGNHRERARKFLAANGALRRRLLQEMREGPRTLGDFADHLTTRRAAGEWGFASDVAQMLFHLTMTGEVMVVGRRGNQNLWGLARGFLPAGTPTNELSEAAYERDAAQRALRALGTATAREITLYFPRGRYAHLGATLADLEHESLIHRIAVEELGPKETRYIHDLDVAGLSALESGRWRPRMSLLPPFDNLLYARTERLFGFSYVREQFLPKAKRRYGTYVLPILWGERFIGRIDPRFDKTTGKLVINAVHAEPGAPGGAAVAEEIGRTVARLARTIGADHVVYPKRLPAIWRGGWP